MNNLFRLKEIRKTSITIITTTLLFTGCGGGSGGISSSSTSTSGTVADGYISGATVCLDINNDGICQSSEPTTITGENGEYSISSTITVPSDTKLIAIGGTDTFTGELFTGELKSPIDLKDGEKNHITPLTTLVSSYVDSKLTTNDALNKVSTELSIDNSMIKGDFIDKLLNGNDQEKTSAAKAATQSYVVQKTVDVLKSANNGKSITEIYSIISKQSIELNDRTGISFDGVVTPSKLTNLVAVILDSSIDGTTQLNELKTKQKSIDIMKEIVNTNGITTINKNLFSLLETNMNQDLSVTNYSEALKSIEIPLVKDFSSITGGSTTGGSTTGGSTTGGSTTGGSTTGGSTTGGSTTSEQLQITNSNYLEPVIPNMTLSNDSYSKALR